MQYFSRVHPCFILTENRALLAGNRALLAGNESNILLQTGHGLFIVILNYL